MQRTGRINMPSYRLIVVEHTEPAKTGKYVEKLGTYDPHTKVRKVDTDRVRYWISKGAQPSPTVHNMLVTIGVLNKKKINVLPKKTVAKAEEPAAAAADMSATSAKKEGSGEPKEAPKAE
jgi:small subunit ribosomal protein S16